MSYFPPPYSPPMTDFNVPPLMPPQMLRPARQASVLLFILAGLALVLAMMAMFLSVVPADQLPPEELQNLQRLVEPMGWTVKTYFHVMAAMMGGMGVILCVLGLLVRGGGRVAIVLAMMMNGLLMLMVLMPMVNAILGGQPLSAILPLGLTMMMIVLWQRLGAAFRAAGAAKAMVMQSWQQFQAPFDAAQGRPFDVAQGRPFDAGYGYNNPLPPPPQSTPPPGGAKPPGNR
jgi:hypothetical protein